MNNQDVKRIQHQAVELLELIEDVAEDFCDDNVCSGEQFYIMMKLSLIHI